MGGPPVPPRSTPTTEDAQDGPQPIATRLKQCPKGWCVPHHARVCDRVLVAHHPRPCRIIASKSRSTRHGHQEKTTVGPKEFIHADPQRVTDTPFEYAPSSAVHRNHPRRSDTVVGVKQKHCWFTSPAPVSNGDWAVSPLRGMTVCVAVIQGQEDA